MFLGSVMCYACMGSPLLCVNAARTAARQHPRKAWETHNKLYVPWKLKCNHF